MGLFFQSVTEFFVEMIQTIRQFGHDAFFSHKKLQKTRKWQNFLNYFWQMTEMSQRKKQMWAHEMLQIRWLALNFIPSRWILLLISSIADFSNEVDSANQPIYHYVTKHKKWCCSNWWHGFNQNCGARPQVILDPELGDIFSRSLITVNWMWCINFDIFAFGRLKYVLLL